VEWNENEKSRSEDLVSKFSLLVTFWVGMKKTKEKGKIEKKKTAICPGIIPRKSVRELSKRVGGGLYRFSGKGGM
jgi:hypothetical protein